MRSATSRLCFDRLTHLAGQIGSQYAAMHSRFSASAACCAWSTSASGHQRENRLPGMQSFRDFMDRRG